jgi:hypothetical protein
MKLILLTLSMLFFVEISWAKDNPRTCTHPDTQEQFPSGSIIYRDENSYECKNGTWKKKTVKEKDSEDSKKNSNSGR